MELLAEHLERQLAAQVRKGLVVWLDKDGVYTSFVERLAQGGSFPAPVLGYRCSFLELLLALEHAQEGLDSEPLLLHVPGHSDVTIRSTPLLEAYRAGTRFERALPTLVREVATGHVSPTEIERFLAQESPDLARAEAWLQSFLQQQHSGLAATLSHLKPEAFLCALLGDQWTEGMLDDTAAIQGYIERHCGLSQEFLLAYLGQPQAPGWRALLAAWVGWLMCVEYVTDLSRRPTDPLLQPLAQLSAPLRKTCLALIQAVRQQFPQLYRRLAHQCEGLIEADLSSGRPEELGKIDTFSREDSRLLEAAVACLHQQQWQQALGWAEERLKAPSVWLESEPLRRHEWQLVQVAARLGQQLQGQAKPLKGARTLGEALELYTAGIHQVDQAHRWFEQDWLRLLEPRLVHFESLVLAGRHLRSLYHSWVDLLNQQFTDLCLAQGFLPEASLQQRTLYEQVVHPLTQRGNTVAYFLVDGLRFEMAAELAQRLQQPGQLELHLNARLAELPSITRVGMNALAPVCRDGHLRVDGSFAGFRAGEYVVRTPEQRLRAMGERSLESLPGGRRSPVGLSLAQIRDESPQALKKKLARCPLVVVHSREIDSSGEGDMGIATFETWLGQLYSAVQRLHNAGVDHFVLTSDHGFLLIDESREPLETKGERRFLLSDAQETNAATAAVSSHSLAYEGAPGYILFPRDASTFRSEGSSAKGFVHGGNSLQERVIPVLSLRYRNITGMPGGQYRLEVEAQPALLGHSRLRLRLREGEHMMLAFESKTLAVALRVVEPEGQGIRVSIKQVHGASLKHQQLLLQVGAEWAEVIFKLEGGSAARARLEAYHADGPDELLPVALAEYFEVLGGAQQAIVGGSWDDAIEDQGHRKVFLHLAEYGHIDEDEVIQLLGDPKAARKFARKFEDYLPLLPFEIAIDSLGPLKRYVRKG